MFAAKTDIPCMFMDIPYILYERGAAPLRKISIDVSSTYSRHILKIYAQIFSLLLPPLEMGFPCYLPVGPSRALHSWLRWRMPSSRVQNAEWALH